MTADEIRLECLKLAHRHDQSPEQVEERAAAYERYVSGTNSRTLTVKAGNPKRVG